MASDDIRDFQQNDMPTKTETTSPSGLGSVPPPLRISMDAKVPSENEKAAGDRGVSSSISGVVDASGEEVSAARVFSENRAGQLIPESIRIKTTNEPTLSSSYPSGDYRSVSLDMNASGILPSVDIDKSFDMCAISDALANPDEFEMSNINSALSSSLSSSIEDAWDSIPSPQDEIMRVADPSDESIATLCNVRTPFSALEEHASSSGVGDLLTDNWDEPSNDAEKKVEKLPPEREIPLQEQRLQTLELEKTIDLEAIDAADIARLTAPEPKPVDVSEQNEPANDSSSIEINVQMNPVDFSRELVIHSDEKNLFFEAIRDDDERVADASEVFASKLIKSRGKISAVGDDKRPVKPAVPEATSMKTLHPDDRKSGLSGYENADYVLEHLFARDNKAFLNEHIGCVGREAEIAKVFDIVNSEKIKRYPRVVEIASAYRMEIDRFIEHIVESCRNAFSHITLYATTEKGRQGTESSCIMSLLESRLGLKTSDDVGVKTERILRTVPQLIDADDKTWAQNVLFSAFDLKVLIKSASPNEFRSSNHDMQMFDLFLKGLRHDAERGPVFVILTHANTQCYDGWREVVAQIRKHRIPNVCILVSGNAVNDLDVSERIELEPISESSMETLVKQALRHINNIPDGFVSSVIAKSHGYVTYLWHIIMNLRVRGVLDVEHGQYCDVLDGGVESLPDSYEELVASSFELLTPDQGYFLTVASIIGEPFKLDDISIILALDPLPDEIPWFRDLRHDWTKRVVQELVDLGIVCPVLDENDEENRLVQYSLRDESGAREIVSRLDSSFRQAIHGCYAQLLQEHSGSNFAIGTHLEQAGMWTEAIDFWLKLAQKHLDNYYNVTALHLLNNCLEYTAPQHGLRFVLLQKNLARLATRFGQYQTACDHYSAMLRVAQLIRDQRSSVEAFVGLSRMFMLQGQYNEARDLLLFGLKLAEQTKVMTLVASCYKGLAEIVLRSGGKGALVGAMRYAERAISIYRELSNLPSLAHALRVAAEIYVVRGDLKRAMSTLSEAYHALKTSNDWNALPPILAVLVDVNIRRKNFREAVRYLREGFAITQKTDDVEHTYLLTSKRIDLYIAVNNRENVREDIEKLEALVAEHRYLPWVVELRFQHAMFDFSRSSFQKTTKSLKAFFEVATELKNSLYTSRGYALSARLNYEVFNRNLGQVSLEKTDKLFTVATTSLESVGAWHEAAENQRYYADYLDRLSRFEESQRCRERADKVDPYCQ